MIHLDLILQMTDSVNKLAEEHQFSNWCERALQHALIQNTALNAHSEWQITVRIVDAAEGQALNRDYRHKDYATNVLSFYYDNPFDEFEFSEYEEALPEYYPSQGDIILCAPVVIQEALEQKKSLLEHTAHLTVHATLHLLGYDHETDDEARLMENLEIAILQELGFNRAY